MFTRNPTEIDMFITWTFVHRKIVRRYFHPCIMLLGTAVYFCILSQKPPAPTAFGPVNSRQQTNQSVETASWSPVIGWIICRVLRRAIFRVFHWWTDCGSGEILQITELYDWLVYYADPQSVRILDLKAL